MGDWFSDNSPAPVQGSGSNWFAENAPVPVQASAAYVPDPKAEAAKGSARLQDRVLGHMAHRDDVPLLNSSPMPVMNPEAGRPVMANPHEDLGWFGQPITGTNQAIEGAGQVANAHNFHEFEGGVSKVIRGAGSAAAPIALPIAAVTAPVQTAIALGSGMLAQKGTEKALDGRVAPETRDLAGDVAGLIVGGVAGHGAGVAGEALDALRSLPSPGGHGVFDVPGKLGEVMGNAAETVRNAPAALEGARDRTAEGLRDSAKGNFERALNPTTRINKALTRDQVAQGLADRKVVATSLNNLVEQAKSKQQEFGAQIDDAFDAHAAAGTKIDPAPVIEALQNERNDYVVKGVVLDPTYDGILADLQKQIKDIQKASGGDGVEVGDLRTIRQKFDKKIARSKGGFAFAPDDASRIDALKTYTDAIRGAIADADPKLAALNKEFNFWSNVEQVADASAMRKTGQRPSLTQSLLENTGTAVGAAAAGPKGAVAGRYAGKFAGKLANSTLWNSLSAAAKVRIADLLSAGDEAGAVKIAQDPASAAVKPAGVTTALATKPAVEAPSAGAGTSLSSVGGGNASGNGSLPGSAVPSTDASGGTGARRVVGANGKFGIPGDPTQKIGFHFEVRELGDVQPSHSGHTFAPNAKSKLNNTRNYDDPANQERIVRWSTPAEFGPSYHVMVDAPTSLDGAPVIDPEGNVLSGNGRTMIMQRVYRSNPKGSAAYRELLKQKAQALGLDAGAVDSFKEPVLVRVLDDGELLADPKAKSRLIADGNVTGTGSLTGSEQALQDAKRVSPETIDHVAARMEQFGSDATLTQALEGQAGGEVLQKLVEDGVIPQQEKGKYLKDGALTKEGRLRVANLIVGRFFEDSEALDNVTPAIRAKLEKMAAPLVKAEAFPEWNLSPKVAAAVDLLHRAKARNMPDLAEFVAQDGLFGAQKYSSDVVRLAESLRSEKSADLVAAARRYSEDASYAGPGASMFGDAPTPGKSFAESFGGKQEAAAAPAAAAVDTKVSTPKPAAPAAPVSPAAKAQAALKRIPSITEEQVTKGDIAVPDEEDLASQILVPFKGSDQFVGEKMDRAWEHIESIGGREDGPDRNFYDAAYDKAPTRTVKLADLHALQNTISRDVVSQKIKALEKGDSAGKLPGVVQMDGKLYLIDGNHTLTAKKLMGETSAQVKFFDLDAKPPAAAPAAKALGDIGKAEAPAAAAGAGTTMYRGAESPALDRGQFPGTFLSTSRDMAAQYGAVHEFSVSAKRFLDIDSKDAGRLTEEFLAKHPDGAPNHDPEEEGPAASDLWLFPTRNWVSFLKSKGYEGTSMGTDHFVFDKKHLKLAGSSSGNKSLADLGK